MATTPIPPPDGNLPPVAPVAKTDDAELTRLRAEITKQGQDFEKLKRQFTAPPAQAVGQPPDIAELNRQFYKDPVQSSIAIAQRAAYEAAQAATSTQRDTLIRMARQEVRSKSPQTFDKYAMEIENAVSQAGPQFATNINVWENAFKMIQGAHIDEILAERGQKAPEPPENRAPAVHISNSGGPSAPSSRAAAAPKVGELDEREKYTARKLGLTEDAYRAGKEAYDNQNDPVRNPVGKSSWDGHMTFSTKERKRQARAAREAAKK